MPTPASRARRNGVPGRRRPRPARLRAGRGAWLAPILGATVIVTLAWAAAQVQSSPEVFVAASVVFSLCEGLVLALVACVWSARGVPIAVLVAVVTAALATPGRWQIAQLHTGQTPQPLDLAMDGGITLLWAALTGLAGSTVLRERLSTLLPGGP